MDAMALASGIGQGFSTVANNVFGLFQSKQQRKFGWDMWNAQNEYNSPAAQLARYKEAGINPAYGAGMASGNAAPVPSTAAEVTRLEVPNVLSTLQQYQTLKNSAMEGKKIEGAVEQQNLTNLLTRTILSDKVKQIKFSNQMAWQKLGEQETKTAFWNAMQASGTNPYMQKYNLDVQKEKQREDLFTMDMAMKNIAYNQQRLGLKDSDSAFLRILAQMWANSEKGPSDILPYYLGEQVLNFGGRLVNTAMPKLPWQKFKLAGPKTPYSRFMRGSKNIEPNETPYSRFMRGSKNIEPNYQFDYQ